MLKGQKIKTKGKKPENIQKLKLEAEPCMLCRLCQGEHSEQLWKMHKGTVEMAQSKTQHKKLWTMQIGLGPKCTALLDNGFESGLNPAEWLHPIYMSCTECGLYLGRMEEDYADILDGMCLKCFMGATDLTVWAYGAEVFP